MSTTKKLNAIISVKTLSKVKLLQQSIWLGIEKEVCVRVCVAGHLDSLQLLFSLWFGNFGYLNHFQKYTGVVYFCIHSFFF